MHVLSLAVALRFLDLAEDVNPQVADLAGEPVQDLGVPCGDEVGDTHGRKLPEPGFRHVVKLAMSSDQSTGS